MKTVGVAPGTITVRLPSAGGRPTLMGLMALPPQRFRWDLVAVVGGGSLIVALAAGLIASALE